MDAPDAYPIDGDGMQEAIEDIRMAIEDIQMAVGEIRDAVCAPASSIIPGVVSYSLIGAAWGWGVVTALRGNAVVGVIHGALWPLSAAFHIARWLAGMH